MNIWVMGCLLIILILATVSHVLILRAIADLPHHEQIQIKGAKSNDHQYARSHSYFSDPFKIVSPGHYLFQEVEEFLSSNPSEVVTLFLKDKVETLNGLAKIFNTTGLMKYMLPLTKMPRRGGDWAPVEDMVAADQRLVVFSSDKTKKESEGIGYQGNFVVEYKYGNHQGTDKWNCTKRDDLSPVKQKSKSLVLLNYYPSTPGFTRYSKRNSKDLMNAVHQCHPIGSDHWANFIAVDYAEGVDDVGPAFEAVNFLNGKLLCGCDDVNSCKGGTWCPSEGEFGKSHLGGQSTIIKTKVITLGYLSSMVFFIICIILKCASRVVRYIKKNKYKLKR